MASCPVVRKQICQTKNWGMENQHKTAYSPTTPVQGLYMIVPWLKTVFRLVSCSEHFDGISRSVDQARMILVVRNKHGRSA
jgi:hypothetical protein